VVGLDTEIDELVEGSELYAPTTHLEDVVLPRKQKAQLVELCAAFFDLADHAKRTGLFDRAVPYGNGFVVLLCGPSGTGKTMTVHGDKAASRGLSYAIDATRLHLLMKRVVASSILSCFGPRRGRRGASESQIAAMASTRCRAASTPSTRHHDRLSQRRRRERTEKTRPASRLCEFKRQAPPRGGRRRRGFARFV